jgi:hypothetical protein
MSITKIKITNNALLTYLNGLTPLTKKSCAISWSVTRSFAYATQSLEEYKKQLSLLVDTFADKKLEDGKEYVQLKDDKIGAAFFKDEAAAYKAYDLFQQEETELSIYKPSKEDLIAYLKTNPPTVEYLSLDKILFDLEQIEL